MTETRDVPCADKDAEMKKITRAGFTIVSCKELPNRPGWCRITYKLE